MMFIYHSVVVVDDALQVPVAIIWSTVWSSMSGTLVFKYWRIVCQFFDCTCVVVQVCGIVQFFEFY